MGPCNLERRFRHCTEDRAFWVDQSCVIFSLGELTVAIRMMSPEVYDRFVGPAPKHNFADWVELVLSQTELADKMRQAGSQEGVVAVLYQYLMEEC